MAAPRFLLHHAPRSRSVSALWMLEEAGASHALHLHDLQAGTQKDPAFLAVNPAGKLPALVDRGPDGTWQAVVTEVAAIAAYLADLLPEAGLAPAIGTPDRAAYQFWMAYGPGVAEPAFADAVFPRVAAAPPVAIGWPPMAEVVARIEAALVGKAWLLGARFSAADLVVGGLLAYINQFGRLNPGPEVARYVAAIEARPARQRAAATEGPRA
jgi:glutathione S-transferase